MPKGVIKRVDLKTLETKDGKEFKKIIFTVDVLIDDEKKFIKTYKADMSTDYCKKYFQAFSGEKCETMGDLRKFINHECDVVLQKRMYEQGGEERTYTFIKYLNMFKDGRPFILTKNKDGEVI